MTEKEKKKAIKAFNKFKATYFAGRSYWTGAELVECKLAFWKQYKSQQ